MIVRITPNYYRNLWIWIKSQLLILPILFIYSLLTYSSYAQEKDISNEMSFSIICKNKYKSSNLTHNDDSIYCQKTYKMNFLNVIMQVPALSQQSNLSYPLIHMTYEPNQLEYQPLTTALLSSDDGLMLQDSNNMYEHLQHVSR